MSFEKQKWSENAPELISEGLKFKTCSGEGGGGIPPDPTHAGVGVGGDGGEYMARYQLFAHAQSFSKKTHTCHLPLSIQNMSSEDVLHVLLLNCSARALARPLGDGFAPFG